MKRIILALLVIACTALVAGCAHTHKKGELGKDSEYHWYKCTVDGCDRQIEKEEHKWDEGKISTSSNKTTKTYTCKFCSAKREEPYKLPDKPTVTKDEWEKAFLSENFKNVTAKISESIVYEGDTFNAEYSIQANGTTIYMVSTTSINGATPRYSGIYQEGTLHWVFSSPEQTLDEASLTTVSAENIMSTDSLLVDYRLDLGHFYDSFTYDAEKKCYVAEDITNGIFNFASIEVRLNNGKITEIKAKDAYATNDVIITMGNYGTTEPKPPVAE